MKDVRRRPEPAVALAGAALAGVGAVSPWLVPGATGSGNGTAGVALGGGVVALLVAAGVGALVGLGRRSAVTERVRPAGIGACGVVLLGLAAAGFATAAAADRTVAGPGLWLTFAGGIAVLVAGVRERAGERDGWTVTASVAGAALVLGGAFAPWFDANTVVGVGERAGVTHPEGVGAALAALSVLALVDLRARGRVAERLASLGAALLGALLVVGALAAVVAASRRSWTAPGVGLGLTLSGGLLVLAGGLRGGVRDGTWRLLVRTLAGREVRVAFAALVVALTLVTADPFRAVVRSFAALRSALFVPVGLSLVGFDAIHATSFPGDEAAAWLQFLFATYLFAVGTGLLARASARLTRGRVRGPTRRIHQFAALAAAVGAVTLASTALLWAHAVDGLAFQGLVGFERLCLLTREGGACSTSLVLYRSGFTASTAWGVGLAYVAASALALLGDAAWHRLRGRRSAAGGRPGTATNQD